jgi:hypothetical protein
MPGINGGVPGALNQLVPGIFTLQRGTCTPSTPIVYGSLASTCSTVSRIKQLAVSASLKRCRLNSRYQAVQSASATPRASSPCVTVCRAKTNNSLITSPHTRRKTRSCRNADRCASNNSTARFHLMLVKWVSRHMWGCPEVQGIIDLQWAGVLPCASRQSREALLTTVKRPKHLGMICLPTIVQPPPKAQGRGYDTAVCAQSGVVWV